MQTLRTAAELRAQVSAWRRAGHRVGFVPTMGNLHAGHYSLVDVARTHADRVVTSVFVNPTQFGPREDFASYPRTPEADAAGLERHGCDLLFTPSVEEMYPYGPAAMVRVEVPEISTMLEGEFRPGHFAGVATVVAKLFHMVPADVAVFGRKDYQQLLVIARMVRDLAMPIEIVAAPTLREANGLAMSSRNQYLSPEERERAGVIHATLQSMATAVCAGVGLDTVEGTARAALEAAGLSVDYVSVRRADDLQRPGQGEGGRLVALAAARIGRARLIDNISIEV